MRSVITFACAGILTAALDWSSFDMDHSLVSYQFQSLINANALRPAKWIPEFYPTNPTLTEILDDGEFRAFELDIYAEPDFPAINVPQFDDTVTADCTNIQTCLQTVVDWLENNPLEPSPIIIGLELSDQWDYPWHNEQILALEQVINDTLGDYWFNWWSLLELNDLLQYADAENPHIWPWNQVDQSLWRWTPVKFSDVSRRVIIHYNFNDVLDDDVNHTVVREHWEHFPPVYGSFVRCENKIYSKGTKCNLGFCGFAQGDKKDWENTVESQPCRSNGVLVRDVVAANAFQSNQVWRNTDGSITDDYFNANFSSVELWVGERLYLMCDLNDNGRCDLSEFGEFVVDADYISYSAWNAFLDEMNFLITNYTNGNASIDNGEDMATIIALINANSEWQTAGGKNLYGVLDPFNGDFTEYWGHYANAYASGTNILDYTWPNNSLWLADVTGSQSEFVLGFRAAHDGLPVRYCETCYSYDELPTPSPTDEDDTSSTPSDTDNTMETTAGPTTTDGDGVDEDSAAMPHVWSFVLLLACVLFSL